MRQLLVATRNRGKIKEIKALLDGLVEEIICAADLPDLPETVEDGATFAENALKKAREASKATGLAVLADDSGLVVDGLGGRPGVYSARFAGVGANDAANNVKLLQEVAGLSQLERRAAFVCSMAYVTPNGVEQLFEGRGGGTIIDHPRGDHGFWLSPAFFWSMGYQQYHGGTPSGGKKPDQPSWPGPAGL
jgi:Xanthosine triphosphate pyrophosphatase